MDCKRSIPLLNAYADHELSKSDASLLEAHLSECPACRAELQAILDLGARVADLGSRDVSAFQSRREALRSAIGERLAGRDAGYAMRDAGDGASVPNSEVSTPSSQSADHESRIAYRVSRIAHSSTDPHPAARLAKEIFNMKFRIGIAAALAAALIIFFVMSSGGSAQAALLRMRHAVTSVHSSHLRIEFNGPIDLGDGDSDSKKSDDDSGLNMGSLLSQGNKSIDVYSEGDKWKADLFGGMQAIYNDGFVTVVMGDKVFFKVKATDAHMPPNMSEYLFKEMSKATDELHQKYNVRVTGEVRDGDRTLQTLEVTGLQDKGKTFRLTYWVDESTNLPARFEVYANDESGQQKLVATITCEFNQDYPDSMFDPSAGKP